MEQTLITEKSEDYELLDSGDGEKLERYGQVVLSRPDPQALWLKSFPEKWKLADAVFSRGLASGKWKILKDIPESWQIQLDDLTFSLKLLPSKHLGVFPEQSVQWAWLSDKIKTCQPARLTSLRVLNLFGYTGGASLACAKAGAEVTHVDASKFAVDLANTNAHLSGFSDKPIRYIIEDVRKFVEREIRRGNKYDIILLDPPVYGKGVKGETWKIEEDILPFLFRIKNLLSTEPLAIILNGYASGYSHITYAQLLSNILHDISGSVISGELAIRESSTGRLLPSGIFARWSVI